MPCGPTSSEATESWWELQTWDGWLEKVGREVIAEKARAASASNGDPLESHEDGSDKVGASCGSDNSQGKVSAVAPRAQGVVSRTGSGRRRRAGVGRDGGGDWCA